MTVEESNAARVQSWIASARSGDAEAMDRLCQHYRPELEDYARRNMGGRARRWTEPEDIVQRVLFEAMRSLGRLIEGANEGDLRRWLRQAASSRIKDAVRTHRRDAGESFLQEITLAGPDMPSRGTVTREDTRRWLMELIARLPEDYREVVRLCGLEELSFVKAGLVLGLEADTVRKRYERARGALRRKLSTREDG